MVTVEDLLLKTLEMLERDDFKAFKWHLQQEKPEVYSGFGPIPRYKLEEADRMETVTLMVQTYSHHAVELVETVLGKMSMYDLAQKLSDRSSELKDTGASSITSWDPLLPRSSRPEDVAMHELQPLEKPIEQFQRTMQTHFRSRFMWVQEGMAEKTEEQCLKDIFIELYITDGGEMRINEQHEIMLTRNSRTAAVLPINPSDIFKSPKGKPLRTVLTTGVAGIGKTILVKKFVLDWVEGRKNQDVHLIFPFSFSELNQLKGKRFSLAKLIHESIWETRDITDEHLNLIFSKLQASGNCDFNNSRYKLLFVLDGLDESRLQMDLMRREPQPLDFDVTQSMSVEVLLTALISGNLLPSARVWITTRPAAASQIHRDFIKRMTVVRGFTDPQKEEYFKKKFPDEVQGSRIIAHIKASRSLFIMCHIPVFCWITSTVLQDVLKSKANLDLPTTLTEMYTEFLLYQITLTGERCGTTKSIRYIKSLAKLAFNRLEKGNLFYESDLKDSGINSLKVSQNAGVFTEVFKEVRKWKDNDKRKMYRFVHLTLQEYLAALHVVMSLINDNKNVLSEKKLKLGDLCTLCRRKPITEVHEIAIEKALSSNGQLDLFLRFLLGLSLQTNQDLLKRLLNTSEGFPQTDHQPTIQSIKERIRENTSPERSINLFHCLNELKDDALVNEIQQSQSSESVSDRNFSPAQGKQKTSEAAMVMVVKLLLETLERLTNEDFEAFRWHLQLLGIYSDFTQIPWYKLQKAERMETVTLMVQTYSHQAVELAKMVLGKMNMNELVQKLSDRTIQEAAMVTSEELLLETLEMLVRDDFKAFKWHLLLPGIYSGCTPIPRYKLQKADRMETVTLMVQTYSHHAVELAKMVLEKMSMYDLAQKLSDRSSELKDVEMQELQPLEKLIEPFQRTMQTHFQSRFMCVQEGMAEKTEEQCLKDIFIELYITEGGEMHINEQHEIMLTRNSRTAAVLPIDPSDIFKSPIGKPLSTVLTTGVAGIGKTFLVKKFVLDWAEGRKNQDVHLIFPFSFSELNQLKGERFSLAKLIHRSIWETKDITDEHLNLIFAKLQASGNCDFNKSQYKLLFVLDGLDESRLQMDLTRREPQPLDFDVTQSMSVEVLLTALISGNLLPSARVWITTRPAAASQIHRDFIKRMTVVRGFTDPQKVEYFKKKFPEQGSRIIAHIKASRSLFIMCHIPVFCWITSTVLQEVLKSSNLDLPTTLTEMYTVFLLYQITLTGERCGTTKSIRYIKSLAKLAFDRLEKGNLFYETDLKDSSINLRKVSRNAGVFTEVFNEVHKWKDNGKEKMYRFVHLTLQEYLAALHVVMSLINNNKNVLSEQKRKPITEVHEIAIEKALSSNGHLDLFLRFLLGLSLPTNQDLLKRLLNTSRGFPQTDHQSTIQSIKERIRDNTSPERSINLFHCLNELKDDALVKEIQQNLSSGSLSASNLSPAHWSALVFILLSSEDTLEVFELKKYCPSEEGLLRLIPVVKASNKSLLSSCSLSENICEELGSVLSSDSSKLRELDLSDNDLQDSGVNHLCVGLESPNCVLQSLRLSSCNLSNKICKELGSVLSSDSCKLRELDLSYNNLKNSGVKLLCVGLESPNCVLQSLRLSSCNLSDKICEALGSVLSSDSSKLRELDLSNNDLQDSGVKLLCVGLESPNCVLQSLRLSGCMVSEKGCTSLASALRTSHSSLKELDLSFNHPRDSGVKVLTALLKDPNYPLETLTLEFCGEQRLKPGFKKYVCELVLDENTAQENLQLSDNCRTAAAVKEKQPYRPHLERFDCWLQVLGSTGLTGRCYWEVKWKGQVYIAVTYKGIIRKGRDFSGLGSNHHSWTLLCKSNGVYSVKHENKTTHLQPQFSPASDRVAVFLDFQAGILSFYKVTSEALIHLHTFNSTFTEPLYPAFGFWFNYRFVKAGSSVSLCEMEDIIDFSVC
ncbi:NACHT, LRR and PYD domains-containing protein 3-like [Platichthys flesus]|uniref:NACHT, LRR and PYD domains-containing protein 3-like n=1 Tax=Platichthys flesus TaxID=8260 RepID=UPI002DB81C6B|nr:NACHT, LRR and PYD domains-containing protein 3-like [Platichthys flesus]